MIAEEGYCFIDRIRSVVDMRKASDCIFEVMGFSFVNVFLFRFPCISQKK